MGQATIQLASAYMRIVHDGKVTQHQQSTGPIFNVAVLRLGLKQICGMLVLASLLYACSLNSKPPLTTGPSSLTGTVPVNSNPVARPSSSPAPALERTPTANTISATGSWKTQPILSELSAVSLTIYKQGLLLGNNPHAFSKVGDGGIASHWFLAIYDISSDSYNLGSHLALAEAIEYFAGSFDRESLAARAGFNTTRILDPLFAMNDNCEIAESPLECELRHHRPSFAIISLGTNQVWEPEVFEVDFHKIVEICIEKGVLPILATKGDNLESDHRINAIIAETALLYDVPLWNFWLAIQSLPDQGLQPDGEHLTWAENNFADPEAMSHAWPVRNLTALQLLRTMMLEVRIEQSQ